VLGVQKADYCACDCQLVRSAQRATNTNSFYKSTIIFLFTHVTNCWHVTPLACPEVFLTLLAPPRYNTANGPVCNSGDNQILTTEFC
jgi:hypothetical protein